MSVPTTSLLDPQRLMQIIDLQTEVARLGLDLGSVMALVAQRSQLLTRADGAVIELAEGDDMVYRASAGIASAQLGLRLSRHTSLSGMCVSAGVPLRCDDCETDDRVDRAACRRVGLRSMIVGPLKHHDTVVGALKVMSRRVGGFDEADLHMLGLMSNVIGSAMYHATQNKESELYYRATHDPLTGLANRALFFDRLRHQLAQAERSREYLSILNLDMDGLKPINDQLGHRAGDAAIKEMTERIQGAARQADTVARMGGDEFAVLLAPMSDASGASLQSERIRERIEKPFAFEGRPLKLGASIGISTFPDDGREPDTLLDSADQAMYAMKRERKGEAARR